MNDDLRDLERQIRAWTARPPSRSPRVARTRVVARLGAPRGGRRWRLAAAATVVAAAVFSAPFLLRSPAPPGIGPPAVAATAPAAGLLIYELRSGTKLYLALASSRPANGPAAKSTFQR